MGAIPLWNSSRHEYVMDKEDLLNGVSDDSGGA